MWRVLQTSWQGLASCTASWTAPPLRVPARGFKALHSSSWQRRLSQSFDSPALAPYFQHVRGASVMAAAAATGGAAAAAGPAPARGAFIVLEGADRAGKSTQCQMLVDHLKASGVPAELWRFPDRTTAIGQMINGYLTSQAEIDDAAVHLLFSANRWEKREELLRTLASGTTLVVDRYAYSGVAFTAAKGLPGLDRAWCQAPDAGLPSPDAVFFLNLTVEQAAARGGFGEERYETDGFQRKVLDQFHSMRNSSWRVIDAAQSVEAIQQQLREQAAAVVARCQRGGAPVGRLWEGASGDSAAPLADIHNLQQQ